MRLKKRKALKWRDKMIVGCLKEIKENENRVALTPNGTGKLVAAGHKVLVEKNAGLGSGFSDEEYKNSGAEIISSPHEIAKTAELVLKIKEPLHQEYNFFNEKSTIFTYFHFASGEQLTNAMIESNATCIAYETVELPDRSLPLLAPMSEVAGKMSAIVAANYLAKPLGGRGILATGVKGVDPAKFLVLGGGIVGQNAAKIAAAMGANVSLLEINDEKIQQLKQELPNVSIEKSSKESVEKLAKECDALIGGVLVTGAKAPKLVSKELVSQMKKGSVIVDVAIDQGGCIETSKATSHSKPVYEVDGVVHYCVANMPGAYPRTSTIAITNATLPYVLELANKGIKNALKENPALMKGLNMFRGKVTYKGVSDAFNIPFTEAEKIISQNF
ncbi:MAG: alanine dehydrogenase [Candidatus Diapherotrites archaeon]